MCLSHANYIESCEIEESYGAALSAALKLDGTVCFKNYDDIGGTVEITLKELSNRVRFYDVYDNPGVLRSYSRDIGILDDLLEEMEFYI